MSEEEKLNEASSAYGVDLMKAEIDALADAIYKEKVLRARQTPLEHKALAGQRLFEAACEVTLWGIRNDFPGKTEEEYLQILRDRLAWRRKRENIVVRDSDFST